MKPITIIGGGLAGLALGIGLRRKGIPVTVLEASEYPRHRVCGEFISGRGQEVLGRFGLLEEIQERSGTSARTAAFVIGNKGGPLRQLNQPAICISRFKLDALLAHRFQVLGGELRMNTRAALDRLGEGFIRATGRRPAPVNDDWMWYGLKIHAKEFPLRADLEMHAFENSYVGLCRLAENEVNVCGLFRKRAKNVGKNPSPHIGGYRRFAAEIPEATDLHRRFAAANLDDASFCSIAGLSLAPHKATALDECSLGDALTMIPPVTGNGMSMAFESAEIALDSLVAYARNELCWADARARIAQACDDCFSSRLRWAKWLQWMMFCPAFQSSLGTLAMRSQTVWNIFFRQTR